MTEESKEMSQNTPDRNTMTVSLTKQEREALGKKMAEFNMTQHSLVKLALRLFLFPKERSKIPVDGLVSVEKTKTGEYQKQREPQDDIEAEDQQLNPSFLVDLKTGKLERKRQNENTD